MIVVHYIAKLLLKWKRLKVFPGELLCLEDIDTILEFIYFLRFTRDELFVFLQHAAQNHDIVRVETESEVVSDLLRHFNIKDSPNTKLDVVSFDRVKELIFN